MVLGFIQYSREAFGALWEHPAGEVAVTEKLWTPHRPHPELISARMEEGETNEYCRKMVEELSERPGGDKKKKRERRKKKDEIGIVSQSWSVYNNILFVFNIDLLRIVNITIQIH